MKLPRRVLIGSLYVVAISIASIGWLSQRQTAAAICQDNSFQFGTGGGSFTLQQRIAPFEDPSCYSNRNVFYDFYSISKQPATLLAPIDEHRATIGRVWTCGTPTHNQSAFSEYNDSVLLFSTGTTYYNYWCELQADFQVRWSDSSFGDIWSYIDPTF